MREDFYQQYETLLKKIYSQIQDNIEILCEVSNPNIYGMRKHLNDNAVKLHDARKVVSVSYDSSKSPCLFIDIENTDKTLQEVEIMNLDSVMMLLHIVDLVSVLCVEVNNKMNGVITVEDLSIENCISFMPTYLIKKIQKNIYARGK